MDLAGNGGAIHNARPRQQRSVSPALMRYHSIGLLQIGNPDWSQDGQENYWLYQAADPGW
jgi:hypothetical protein